MCLVCTQKIKYNNVVDHHLPVGCHLIDNLTCGTTNVKTLFHYYKSLLESTNTNSKFAE